MDTMNLLWVFLAVLTLVFAVLFFMLRPPASDKKLNARIHNLPACTKEVITDEDGLVREEEQGVTHLVGERLRNFHLGGSLERLIVYADSHATLGSIALASFGLAVIAGFAVHVSIGSFPLEVIASILAGSLRYVALKMQASSRLKNFETALPDAIDLMARALRAGHSLASAIEVVSEQSAEPLKSEFALCFQQQKFGVPFREALLAMTARIPSKDLRFVITAILVQKETGGDLTDILDRTTRVIRERVKIQGEVRTYTAQGRLTGWILGLMPAILLLLLNVVTPGYSTVLFHDPLGQKMLYAGTTLVFIGGLIIRKIVDIKV
jgi:tight adherence protein B